MFDRISWPLVSVVVVGTALISSGWLWWVGADPDRPPVDVTHQVVYSVTGRGHAARVSWSRDIDAEIFMASAPVALPWTGRSTVARSAFTALVEVDADRAPVACSIRVDGILVTTDIAPAGQTAACRYTFTAP